MEVNLMDPFVLSEEFHIYCRLVPVGEDLCVIISGGDMPHIGAVSAGIFGAGIGAAHMRPDEEARLAETVHTYTYPSHRDHFVGEPLAKNLAQRLERNVVVLCGIHIENLPQEKISQIVDLTGKMEEKIYRKVREL